MQYSTYDPRSHTQSGSWVVETETQACKRLPAFGLQFIHALADVLSPHPYTTHFLRWSVQPDDVDATFEFADFGFGLQIDPALEYIIIFDANRVAEYGDWNGDRLQFALAHIRRLLDQTAP